MSWVVRAPDRELERGEKKTYTRVRRVLWDYEPLRASHAEIFIDVSGDQIVLRGRVRTLPQKLISSVLVARMPEVSSVVNELVADPETVLGRLFDHLELDASRAQLLSHVESAYRLLDVTKTEHRTTDAVSASTGRWVNDLPPAIRDACEMSLAEPLRQFGYA